MYVYVCMRILACMCLCVYVCVRVRGRVCMYVCVRCGAVSCGHQLEVSAGEGMTRGQALRAYLSAGAACEALWEDAQWCEPPPFPVVSLCVSSARFGCSLSGVVCVSSSWLRAVLYGASCLV